MFPAVFSLILIGIPVAFALLAVSMGLRLPGCSATIVGIKVQSRLLEVPSNYVLSAIPLFVFMGAILERSGVAERVFSALRLFLGKLPGGTSP